MDTPGETRSGYTLSTDKGRLDVALIHQTLSQHAYWAQGRPEEVVRRSIEHSLCLAATAMHNALEDYWRRRKADLHDWRALYRH